MALLMPATPVNCNTQHCVTTECSNYISMVDTYLVCDEVVDRESALEIAVNESGHLVARFEPSEGSALPLSAGDQLEGPSRDLMSGGCNADHAGLAPAAVRALESSSHDASVSRGVEGIVYAPGGERHDVALDGGALRQLERVDAVGGTQGAGYVELLCIDVDGEDTSAAAGLASLDDGESHCTEAENSCTGARLHIASVPRGAESSGDAAAEQTHSLERSIVADLGTGDLGDNSILAESGGSHEMIHNLVSDGEARGAIRHHTLTLCATDFRAQVSLGASAEDAVTALRSIARNNLIAWLHTGDALTYRLYDTTSLVTQDAWKLSFRVATTECIQISMTEGISNDFETNFPSFRGSYSHIYNLKRLVRSKRNSCFANDRLPSSTHLKNNLSSSYY